MNRYTALYDACVLFPANLRSLLMWLAVENVFRAKMDENVEECLVTDYQSLVPMLSLPDPDDRHVLAAAVVGRADVIVTFNLKDFPPDALSPYGVEAQHPDDFVTHLFDLFPEAACHAVRSHRESMKNPPRTVEQYAAMVEKAGLPKTASEVRRFADLL